MNWMSKRFLKMVYFTKCLLGVFFLYCSVIIVKQKYKIKNVVPSKF